MSSIITSITNRLQPVVDFVRPAVNKLSDITSRIFAASRDAVAPLTGRVKEPLKNALSSKYTLVTFALGIAGTLVYFGVKQYRKEPSVPAQEAPVVPSAEEVLAPQTAPVEPTEAQEKPPEQPTEEAAAPQTPPQPKKSTKTHQSTPRPTPIISELIKLPTKTLIEKYKHARVSQDNRNLPQPDDMMTALKAKAERGDKKAQAFLATL